MSVRGVTPVVASNFSQLLFVGRALNFQSTADQPLKRVFSGTNYIVTSIYARQRSGGASVACAGGLYDTAAKGGNAVVAAVQSWVTLASGIIVTATLAGLSATTLLTNTLILSLTTGSTAAITADVFVTGLDVS